MDEKFEKDSYKYVLHFLDDELFSEIKLFDLVLIGCEFSSENKLDIFLY